MQRLNVDCYTVNFCMFWACGICFKKKGGDYFFENDFVTIEMSEYGEITMTDRTSGEVRLFDLYDDIVLLPYMWEKQN